MVHQHPKRRRKARHSRRQSDAADVCHSGRVHSLHVARIHRPGCHANPKRDLTPQRLERNWSSTAYYNSPMPFSIFFHRGYAIHGSYAIDRLGGPASHGCVRLHPHHAAILFDLVQLEGPSRTTIEVTDQGRPMEPSLPRREMAAGPGMNPPPGMKPGMNQPPLVNPPPPMNPPPQGRVRYPLTADEMPNLAPAQPPIQRTRLSAAKNALPPRPRRRRSSLDRRCQAARQPAARPRGAGEAEMTIGASRSANEFSEPRPRPKPVEGPRVAERSNPNRRHRIPASRCCLHPAGRVALPDGSGGHRAREIRASKSSSNR